ncbi:glycosyltransferase family 2 protein [Dyadobacter subterraneus]|uniref:Glycosyltransferase family 2 protein n=1 Tax=Dyadobacter subterraneus TaxID=2773304 RepID=A0ABR9WFJ2_9BACT|nr:glycosyltransferase family 2 protein [Dyadobacter subterraneus]MBE9464163.1 glycosyltransferase family 2 protein [Dyadobacter subterraneus]
MNDQQNTPLVSIALCIYNGEKFMREQLETLVNQTYPNLEIIAVDDRSKDSSLAILKEYADKYPFFTFYENEENLGYVKNFEKAISLCNGELIALSDQDDIWDLDKIRLQVEAIGDSQLVYHDSTLIDEKGKPTGKKMSDIINLYSGDNPKTFLFFNCISGHSCMIRKDLLPWALPFHKDFFHDQWLAYVAANVGKIEVIHDSLVQYRQHSTSSTDIMNKRKKINKKYHENRDILKMQKELKWLKHCQSYKFNKYQDFVNRLVTLFEERLSTFLSFRYSRLLNEEYQSLYYIPKYKKASQSAYVFRHIWGMKSKILWARIFG